MNVPFADEPARPRTSAWVKAVLVLCCAVVASMWIYYCYFATDEGV